LKEVEKNLIYNYYIINIPHIIVDLASSVPAKPPPLVLQGWSRLGLDGSG